MKNHPKKTFFNWSSGKDAAFAFYKLKQDPQFNIDLLLTSVNEKYDRVSMHGLPSKVLDIQAKSIGIPLQKLFLPEQPSMEVYSNLMDKTISSLSRLGYSDCGFGDIFLEDLREYREKQLKPHSISCHFPLWNMKTKNIILDFIDKGFKAVIIALDANALDKSFLGRSLDRSLLNDLPSSVDPCGENGEFHTFCYDGPIFQFPIEFEIGEKIYKEYKSPNSSSIKHGFWFCDIELK